MNWFKKSGCQEAICILGHMYLEENDIEEALKWFVKSALKGHVESRYMIGWLNLEKNNKEMSIHWFTLAAQSHIESQYILGLLYYNGEIVKKNIDAARFWFVKAAEKGHMNAQYNIGLIDSVCKDNKSSALYWFRKAANQGHQISQQNINIF